MAGVYIHIPFCKNKCNYCNFFSVVSTSHLNPLIDAIKTEAVLRKDYCEHEEIQTIYFGGGTPSLLNYNHLHEIFEILKANYYINNNAEITLEINPDDVSETKAEEWKLLGFNRVSVGTQSFDNNVLQRLGRKHNSDAAYNALKTLKKSGFENISADVIFGVPQMNNQQLLHTLNILIDFQIPHISAYALTVEPKTALDVLIKKGKEIAPDEDVLASQFLLTIETLRKADYIHYEISNYAKDGYYSIHNSNYWKNNKYIGLGPSAHSYNCISRQWNISNITEYIETINSGIIPAEKEILSNIQKCNEYILTSLRTIWGTDLNKIKNIYGDNIYNLIKSNSLKYIKNNMLINNNEVLYLTDKGKLYADKICSDLFVE
jgi:oxygen-independent coproporphyrinogen-3 oxidase